LTINGMVGKTKTRRRNQCCGSEIKFIYFFILFFGSGSGFNLNSGFGSGLFMKKTFELKIIYTLQKSKFLNICTFLDPDCLEKFF
jgi:hypothetical protein